MVGRYRTLIRTPGIPRIFAGYFAGGLPAGMVTVAVASAFVDTSGGLTPVGLVIAVYSLAIAATAPVLGRLADRFGARVVLRLTGFAFVVPHGGCRYRHPERPRHLSTSASPLPRSAIVTRLRAAGCVFAEDEARLLISAARTPAELADMVDRRAAGRPLEHVLGWAEFCGLRVAVDPGVFIPRRRTEFLVHQASALVRSSVGRACRDVGRQPVVIVDLCCGSGAVGAALVAALGRVELYAVDIDPAAVRCARRNLAAAASCQVYEGDLYQPLPATLRGRVEVLVANVPYVPTGEIGQLPPEARIHEPQVALDGGADGLDVLRRVTAAAARWLAPGGHLLVEISARQEPEAVETVARNGLLPQVASSEERNATVVIGTRVARQS